MEFHIATERQNADAPARPLAIDESRDFRSEAERERIDLHAAKPSNEEVPQLMKEDDDAEDEQERHNRSKDRRELAGK